MNRRSKRQDLPRDITHRVSDGYLQVVATPIGNLQDVTARMRHALESADIILAEDTRRTLQLLQALQITGKRLERLDSHEEYRTVPHWIEKIESGARIALVSDAGTPGISDPGSLLVQEALRVGLRVEPIPGPSAVSVFASISGFAGETPFGFLGFFPRSDQERAKLWRELLVSRGSCRVWFFFESPERIESALTWLSEHASGQVVQARAVKELTKMYEKIFAGDLSQVLNLVRTELQNEGVRGEWCFAIQMSDITSEPQTEGSVTQEPLSGMPSWQDVLQVFSEIGAKDSESAKWISKLWNVDRKVVYDRILQQKNKEKNRSE